MELNKKNEFSQSERSILDTWHHDKCYLDNSVTLTTVLPWQQCYYDSSVIMTAWQQLTPLNNYHVSNNSGAAGGREKKENTWRNHDNHGNQSQSSFQSRDTNQPITELLPVTWSNNLGRTIKMGILIGDLFETSILVFKTIILCETIRQRFLNFIAMLFEYLLFY